MHRLVAIATALVLAAGMGWAQDDPKKEEAKKAEKEAEEKAKQKVKAFQAELKKCREMADYVSALDGLGDEPHPLILTELKKWLGNPSPDIRKAAAAEIAKFKKDKAAASSLIAVARGDKTVDVVVECLKDVGDIGCRAVAKDLIGFFVHKEVDIAKEAVDSCGKIKSKDTIEPLIDLITTCEVDKEKATQSQSGGGGNVPGGMGGNVPGGSYSNNQEDEKKKRAEALLPRAIQAMKDITGEKCNTSKEWKKWWAKSKPFFKEPGEEDKDKK